MQRTISFSIFNVLMFFIQATLLASTAAGSGVDSLSLLDGGIYKIVKTKCQNDDSILLYGEGFLESMKSSFLETSKVLPEAAFSAIKSDADFFKNLYANKGLSPGMKTILDSDGLFVALRECFREQGQRDHFVLNLILSDVAGRGVGSIQGFLLYLFSFRLILRFATKVYDVLLTTRFGARINPLARVQNIASIASGITAMMSLPILYSTHTQIKEAAREDEIMRQSEKALLNEALARIQRLKKQRISTTDTQTLNSIEQEIGEYKKLYTEIYEESLLYKLFDLKNYLAPEQIL